MSTSAATEMRGYTADKTPLLNRLRRVEGQIRGVARMVDEERYCIDVLTQIGAAQSALDGVSLGLLDGHVRHCIANGDGELETKAAEVVGALAGGAGRLRHDAERPVLRTRLGRATSRVTRIIAMVEAGRYCIDVLDEINAVKRTLDAVALGLVDGHIRTCMTHAGAEERDEKARELLGVVGRLIKTT